jgi:hypothetical protein
MAGRELYRSRILRGASAWAAQVAVERESVERKAPECRGLGVTESSSAFGLGFGAASRLRGSLDVAGNPG